MKGILNSPASVIIGGIAVILAAGTEIELTAAQTEDQAAELSVIAGFDIDWSHTTVNDKGELVNVSYGRNGERIEEYIGPAEIVKEAAPETAEAVTEPVTDPFTEVVTEPATGAEPPETTEPVTTEGGEPATE